MSPLLFVVSLLPLKLLFRKMKQRYNFGKGQRKLNHLVCMNDLILHGGSQPDNGSLIQTVYIVTDHMGFGNDKCGDA